MSDFDIFDEIVGSVTETLQTTCKQVMPKQTCKHINVTVDKNSSTCVDCGEEIDVNLSNDIESIYYGSEKRLAETDRIRYRKNDEKNIFKDIDSLELTFKDNILQQANNLYLDVTNKTILRGESRRSIIFACIFYCLKISGNPIEHNKLISMFKINRRTGLRGIKYVNVNMPKHFGTSGVTSKNTYITPLNLIDEIMNKFSASETHKNEVKALFDKINNKSSTLNRARPQSIAAGIIYYWICTTKKNIDIKEYTQIVNLSESTIVKLKKEITLIMNTTYTS